MNTNPVSDRIPAIYDSYTPIYRFMRESAYAQRNESSENCDFTFGNPHDMPLTGYVQALQKAIIPQDKKLCEMPSI